MCGRDKGPNLHCLRAKNPHIAGRLWASTGFMSLLLSKADQVGFLYAHHLVISFSCFKRSDSPSSFWPTVTRAFFWIPHAMESKQVLLKSLSQEATFLLWSDSLGLGNNMAWFTSKFKGQVCDFFIIFLKKRLSTHNKTSKFLPWLFFFPMAFLGQHTLFCLHQTFPETQMRVFVCAE